MEEDLLSVNHLEKLFPIKSGLFQRATAYIHAVNGVSFHIRRGETIGLVGESGCGKSTLGRCIIRLIEPTSGEVKYKGTNILDLNRKYLSKNIQMVFQDPMSSLNPRLTVGYSIGEPLLVRKTRKTEMKSRVLEILNEVGLNPEHFGRYPHEFSGGQRQRILISKALITDPEFIILDEPTSSLDVSVQATILNLLNEIKKRLSITYLFISHDLSVIRHMSDRVFVMYVGKLVEMASKKALFADTLHPYTQLLLNSIPTYGAFTDKELISSFQSIELPSNINLPQGCRFKPRCPQAMDICEKIEPKMIEVKPEHFIACHLYS